MKIFRINANTERDFFKKVLLVLSSIINIKPSAIDVLAEILVWNDKYKDLPKDTKNKLLLSYETKQKMIDALEMTPANFHNQLHYLRKKNIIRDNKLRKEYDITIEDFDNILYSIELKKENDG